MLRPLNINLLSGMVIAIILLGAVSAVTVFMNAQTYRDLAFDFQRQYMTQLVAAETADILAEQADIARRMGLSIQKDGFFRAAFNQKNATELAAVLDTQYHRAPVTSGLLNVVSLYVYDIDLQLQASSSRYQEQAVVGAIICPALVARAVVRQAAARLKPLNETCMHGESVLSTTLIPVGGLAPTGYLQVVYNPMSGLVALGARLKMPVQISAINGSVLFASPGWVDDGLLHSVQSSFTLKTLDATPIMQITAARNADALVLKIERTNRRLLLIVTLVLLVSVVLSLLIVKYSVFKPLQSLSNQLKERWSHDHDGVIPSQHAGKEPAVSFHALGELYETLRDMAIRDPLTGTYNRALLEDRLRQLIAEHRRTPSVAAVLLTDMVRFKYVNDMLGHHTGDLLLKKVVARMAEVLRESDTLARLGGDEFVILLPDTDANQAVQVAQKIIQSMQREFDVKGHKLSAAITIGIALMPDHGEEVDVLLRNADYAMYTAKDHKQGYAIHDPATTEQIVATRMTLDGILNEDIDRNDLFLVYQPVIEFATGRISYLEALLRWRQSDGSIMMPDMFIRAAEQSGLIKQLSEWVIETACRELSELQGNHPELRAGINLSMHNLHDFNLVARIEDALERYNLQAESLLLEITETGVMLDPSQVIEMLEQLAARGLKLSIDDFGTGHSSLVHLRRLPVHTLKVDKSFVVDMDVDEDNASIVRATIDLAHSLGLTVTAEGVETRTVHDQLREMKCDYYQGYFIGKPMALVEIKRWLDKGQILLHEATP